jgi:transcriptional regulator with XRE-family HTH domain
MKWNERAWNIIEERKIAPAMLSELTGISEGSLSRYKTGIRGQDSISIAAVIAKALNVAPEYLIFGVEKTEPFLTVQTVPKMHTFHRDFAAGKFLTVRLLQDHIAAGSPSHINENDVDGYCIIYSSKDWMEHDPENYTCVTVTGRSMYPILDSGDIVAIDHSERNPLNLDKKMVAFRKDGGVTIKWLIVKEAGEIILGMPENKEEYDSVITLRGKEVETGIIGKIAWWWAKRR